ncbi:hypothetical protein [Actinoplanes sp. NPDC026670]
MNTVLSLVSLANDDDESGFLNIISGNSGDSYGCGSGDSRGC